MRLAFVAPLLPTLVEKPPEGDDWIHEVKFDGYRSQIVIDDDGVRIFTRNGLDWTSKYRDLVESAKQLPVTSAIIDGEIVVLNEQGLSDFGALRKAIDRRQHDLYFVAFDVLHLDDHDLRDMALKDRPEILHGIIQPGSRIQFSEPMPGEAKAIFHLIDKAGLEDMVSKRRDSKYRSGRSTSWLKVKSYATEEYDLLGVERESGKPAFAVMADRKTGEYVGSAFINSRGAIRDRLWKRVQEHAGPAPKGMKRPATQRVKPGVIGRVSTFAASRIYATLRCRISARKGMRHAGGRSGRNCWTSGKSMMAASEKNGGVAVPEHWLALSLPDFDILVQTGKERLMPIQRKATDAGILQPSELVLLGRVFELLRRHGQTDEERDAIASRIIANYMAGVTDEGELVALSRQPLGR